MHRLVYGLVILLAILHQDFWYWNDPTLVFGFMPVGLAYHALFSLCAAGVWALAVKYAWPATLDESLEPPRDDGAESTEKPSYRS